MKDYSWGPPGACCIIVQYIYENLPSIAILYEDATPINQILFVLHFTF